MWRDGEDMARGVASRHRRTGFLSRIGGPVKAWVGGARPMLWQVASGFAYRTTGGYFIGSDATHDVLVEAPASTYEQRASDIARGGAPPDDAVASAARDELRALGVSAVVVVPEGADVGAVLDWTRRVTRLPGEQVDDVWLFRLTVG